MTSDEQWWACLLELSGRRYLAVCRASTATEAKQRVLERLRVQVQPLSAIKESVAWHEAIDWAGWEGLELLT